MSDERPTGPMFGTMVEADFPADTITLEMEPGYYTAAARFAVIRAEEFSEIVEQRAALLEALRESVDLAWIPDSRSVEFDHSVRFGPHYDFSGLDESTLRQEFHGQYECIVWPGRKWSAYCTYEGSTWFEKFDTAEEAKEQCMRLLDRVLPEHPAMKARAAIALAQGDPA